MLLQDVVDVEINMKKKSEKRKLGFFKKIGSLKYEILVFIFFVLMRLPSLGHDNFNTDVWKWKSRSYNFGSGLFSGRFDQTLQTYHPGVTLMWLGGVGVKVNNYMAKINNQSLVADDNIQIIFQLDFVQKLLVVLVMGIAISFIFYVLKNVFGLKYALFSAVMLNLEPFYLGLTRVFHLEGLVSTFMLASIIWLYYFFLDRVNRKRLIISGIFAGLAFLTKTSALFLIPFCGLVTLIYVFRNGNVDFKKGAKNTILREKIWKLLKSFGSVFFMWLGVLLLVFFALWPAMWVMPGKVTQTLYSGVADVGVEGDHFQFYFGKFVENPGPSFYFVVLALKSSIYLLVGFIGSLFIRKKLPEDKRKFLDYLLIFVFFYFIQLTIPTKKLDRYILPALVVISLLSSIFFIWIFEKINFKKTWQKIVTLVLFLIPAVYTNVYVHPDYFSYFNPMFGGLKTGVNIIEPKWIIGEREILNYFTELSDKTGMEPSISTSFEELVYKAHGKNLKKAMTVGFKEKYYSQVWPFFRERGAWAIIENLTPFADKTKYFVYPVWDDYSSQETRFRLSYFDTIYLRGVPMYNVYKNETEGVHAQ